MTTLGEWLDQHMDKKWSVSQLQQMIREIVREELAKASKSGSRAATRETR